MQDIGTHTYEAVAVQFQIEKALLELSTDELFYRKLLSHSTLLPVLAALVAVFSV
jgi:hypothetical protein